MWLGPPFLIGMGRGKSSSSYTSSLATISLDIFKRLPVRSL